MGMKEGRCLRCIKEPSVLIIGCFENKESLNCIRREPMMEEGEEKLLPLLEVAKLYIEKTGAKTAVEVFEALYSKFHKLCSEYESECEDNYFARYRDFFKRCKKLAKKFSSEYIDPIILQKVQEEKECYYHIIDGTHRLVVYAVLVQLEEKEYDKVKCVVYKKAEG